MQTRLLKSPELQSLRDSEERLIQMRDARFANLGEAREHEERAEGLQDGAARVEATGS